MIAIVALVLLATFLAEEPAVVPIAGALGLITYLAVNEVVTGLVGVAFILSALAGSIVRNRRAKARGVETQEAAGELAADHSGV